MEEIKLIWEEKVHSLCIPFEKFEGFENLFKKLIKFSKVLNFPKPTYKKLDTFFKYKVYEDSIFTQGEYRGIFETVEEIEKFKNNQNFLIIPVEFSNIELTCVSVIKPNENWLLMGIIDYKEEIVKPAPGQQIPIEYLNSLVGRSYCDHCKKTVLRNKIAFIKNEEKDEIKRIGGSCIKYYLGFDYEKVLGFLSNLNEVIECENISDEIDYYKERSFHLQDYSAKDLIKYYAFFVKKTNSHLSKKSAEKYNSEIIGDRMIDQLSIQERKNLKEATSDIVVHFYEEIRNMPDRKDFKRNSDYEYTLKLWQEKSDEFYKAIETVSDEIYIEFVEFVKSKISESNFMFNAFYKINQEMIESNHLKYISGACSFYFGIKISEEMKRQREEKRKNELENQNSNYIGTIGEKSKFINVEVKSIRSFQTDFGYSNIYNLEDVEGNQIVKFGTISEKFLIEGDEIIVGSKLSFISDVKDHKSFKDIKQTTIGRLSKLK